MQLAIRCRAESAALPVRIVAALSRVVRNCGRDKLCVVKSESRIESTNHQTHVPVAIHHNQEIAMTMIFVAVAAVLAMNSGAAVA
ncbi:MAG TPA: hypothetical protein VKI44_21055 [Acetobacteraceae bacterium]|nr:hypothetical protein [Acetobacteraceae bacterium]